MAKKRRTTVLIILGLVLILVVGAGVAGRVVVLHSVRGLVQASFDYSRMSLSLFPPALVLEDVKSKSNKPFFSARRISLTTGLLSLLSRNRPVSLVVDHPVLRASEEELRKLTSTGARRTLPFTVARALVREADITLEVPGATLHSWKGNGFFSSRGRNFTLEGAISDNVLTLPSPERRYQASLHFVADGSGSRVQFRRLVVEGPALVLKAKGLLDNLSNPDLDFSVVFDCATALPMEAFEIPFEWGGRVRGEGTVRRARGELAVESTLSSRDVTMTGMPLGEVAGHFHLDDSGGVVDLTINKRPEPRAIVKVQFDDRVVRGTIAGVKLDPFMKEIELAWPVESPAWGEFVVQNDHLHVDAELRSANLLAVQGDRFPFRGRAVVDWDGQDHVTFDARKLLSSFGQVDLVGRVDIDRDMDVSITGEVSDVRQARRFTELFLETEFDLPDTTGRGSAEVRVAGAYDGPTITSQFFLYPGGFGRFVAAFVEGRLEIRPDRIKGTIRVDDPQMTGVVDVLAETEPERLNIDIKATRARVGYILSGLEVDLPLTGEASGQFKVESQADRLRLGGDFSAGELALIGLTLREVQGRLVLDGKSLEFQELRFNWNGGPVEGRGRYDFAAREYALDLQAKSVDLSPLVSGLRGTMAFGLKGQGLLGRDAITGRVEIQNPGFDYFRASSLDGDLTLNSSDGRLEAALKGGLGPGSNEFTADLTLPLGGGPYSLNLKGSFENLDILLPWPGAKGRLNYLAEVRAGAPSSGGAPTITGAVDVQGPVLPLPGYPQALTDFSALALIANQTISLRSFQAKLGGGNVQGSGEIRLSGPSPILQLGLEGKDMILVPWERTRALADASLRLIKDPSRFVLEGDIFFKRLNWRREIGEPFALRTTAFYEHQPGSSLFENMHLDISLQSSDDAWLDNSLGRIRMRLSLKMTGTVDAPVIQGDIETVSGTVNFQGRTFNILSGKLSFFNPLAVEPYLDFKAETYVKDYRVTFSLSGLIDHLRPEYASSPPLPPEDVLALLATGESFKRTYIPDLSSQVSSASLLAYQLSEEAQKRASRIFSLDRISIDPFIMGSSSELVPRLTLGKKISRNLSLYYSTNLTTQREEIVRVEWELGRSFSLVGNRDELGIISLDVKVRKRF
jgi:hypothetical protein